MKDVFQSGMSKSPKSLRAEELRQSKETYLLRSKERILLSTVCWYWGDISIGQTNYLMQHVSDGAFLVAQREKKDKLDTRYSIAVKLQGKIYYLRVESENNKLSLDFANPSQPKAVTLYGLVAKLIQKSKANGTVGEIRTPEESIQINIKDSIARISSLKAHCRRVIRLQYETDRVDYLPIPKSLQTYLKAV